MLHPPAPASPLGVARLRVAGAAILALAATAGCARTHTTSNGPPSAAAQACISRNALSRAIHRFETNVKAANFGAARDNVNQARAAAASLKTAVRNLPNEERQRVEPQIDQMQNYLASLTPASGLSHVATTARGIRTQFSSALNTIRNDLTCS
jgi:hypothetical protein